MNTGASQGNITVPTTSQPDAVNLTSADALDGGGAKNGLVYCFHLAGVLTEVEDADAGFCPVA